MDFSALVLVAHRGAPMEFPENTIESFRAAQSSGADVLEMDVRTTLDGYWVIAHDESLERMMYATGRVDESTYGVLVKTPLRWPTARSAAEHNGGIEPHMALLEDVLDVFPNTPLNIDLKDVVLEDVRTIVASIEEKTQKPAVGRAPHILLTSERDDIQAEIRRWGEGIVSFGMSRSEVLEVLRTAWRFGGPIERLRGFAFQAPAYVTALGIDWPVFTAPVRRLLTSMNCPSHLWRDDGMIDDVKEARLFAERGATGIFTNNIRAMVQCARPSTVEESLNCVLSKP